MNFLVCDDEMKIVEQVSTLLQEHCMENGIHAQIHALVAALAADAITLVAADLHKTKER